MNCKCGSEMIFNDNSISNIGNNYETEAMYYCPECKIIWNGFLICEGQWVEVKNKRYKKWFTKEAIQAIKNFYICEHEENIKRLDSYLKLLG